MQKDGERILLFVTIGLFIFILFKGFSGQATRSDVIVGTADTEDATLILVDDNPQQNIVTIPPGLNVQIAPPFCQAPIAPGGISITAPGLYKLCGGTVNLPSPIRILADDVTLDCANTHLIGTPAQAFNGIEILGNRVTITSCKLSNFKNAIYIDRKDETKIFNSELFNNIYGVYLDGGDPGNIYYPQFWYGKNFEFTNNNIHNNIEDGIYVKKTPAYWYSYSTAKIKNSNINNNKNGIHFVKSDQYTVIEYSTISQNNENGIYLDEEPPINPGTPGQGSADVHIRFNTISNNGQNGIKLRRSSVWGVYKNTISNNGQNNIYIWPAGYAFNVNSNNILNSIDGIHAEVPNINYPNAPYHSDSASIDARCNNIKFHSNAGINYYQVSQNPWGQVYLWMNRIENNNNYGLYIDYPTSTASPGTYNAVINYNEFKNNQNGVYAVSGGNRIFYHNNFIANVLHAYDVTNTIADQWDYTYWPGSGTHGNYWDNYVGTPDPSNLGHYYGPRIIPPSSPIPNQDNAPEINPVGIPLDPTINCQDQPPPAVCGDGVVNQFWEQCDPPDMGVCLPGQICIPPGQPNECHCTSNFTIDPGQILGQP